MKHVPIERQVVPFPRRWHVISEVDLAPVLADHAAMRRLCRRVEELADQLAELPALEQRLDIAETIRCCIHEHLRVTSTFLDRFFAGEMLDFGPGVLARLLLDQISDALHAEDVIEALCAQPLEPAGIETLGYMLRCLFDNYRRAVDFEELTILSLAGSRLSSEAQLALQQSLDLAGER